MHQHSTTQKRTEGTVVSKSEYRQADLHNNVNEDTSLNGVSMEAQSFACTSGNKEVSVTLLFPTQSDKKAEQEFMNMLKEIYLNKIKIGSMQSDSGEVKSSSTNKVVEREPDFVKGNDTKEDKNHE